MTDFPHVIAVEERRFKFRTAWAIIRFLAPNPDVWFTYDEVREAVDCDDRRLFSGALTQARHLAIEHDHHITWGICEEGTWVLAFDPTESRFLKSVVTRLKSVTAQNVNLVDGLDWGARCLPNPVTRRILKHAAQATQSAVEMNRSLVAVAQVLLSPYEDPPIE
jgi:hypothetical protein